MAQGACDDSEAVRCWCSAIH